MEPTEHEAEAQEAEARAAPEHAAQEHAAPEAPEAKRRGRPPWEQEQTEAGRAY